jgi:hypothetical protein
MACKSIIMSGDRTFELHEVVKDPLRQKILLKLGQHDSIEFDSLVENLKLTDTQELSNQLVTLQEVTIEGEHIVTKQGNSYQLTEKGHEVLDEMIAFPQLGLDNYREKLLGESSNQSKPKPKWFSPYWIAIFASAVLVVGVIIPFFSHQTVEETALYLTVTMLILAFGYYVRVKQPSMRTNRLIYIGLFSFFFGCWFSLGSMFLFARIGIYYMNSLVIVTWIGFFVIGGVIGDLIGKARNYKGPAQYSP